MINMLREAPIVEVIDSLGIHWVYKSDLGKSFNHAKEPAGKSLYEYYVHLNSISNNIISWLSLKLGLAKGENSSVGGTHGTNSVHALYVQRWGIILDCAAESQNRRITE